MTELFGTDLEVPIIFPNDTARARLTDPPTSHAAADSNLNREEVAEHVLHLLKRFGPMTDEELTLRYLTDTTSPPAHFDSPRKRRSDLTKTGQVIATTTPGQSRTGRRTTTWSLA